MGSDELGEGWCRYGRVDLINESSCGHPGISPSNYSQELTDSDQLEIAEP